MSQDRRFVWTWWAGLVSDSFGPESMFACARWGALRRAMPRACAAGGVSVVGAECRADELRFCSNRAQLVRNFGLGGLDVGYGSCSSSL